MIITGLMTMKTSVRRRPQAQRKNQCKRPLDFQEKPHDKTGNAHQESLGTRQISRSNSLVNDSFSRFSKATRPKKNCRPTQPAKNTQPYETGRYILKGIREILYESKWTIGWAIGCYLFGLFIGTEGAESFIEGIFMGANKFTGNDRKLNMKINIAVDYSEKDGKSEVKVLGCSVNNSDGSPVNSSDISPVKDHDSKNIPAGSPAK